MKILEKHISRSDNKEKISKKKHQNILTSKMDVQVGDIFLVLWPDNKSETRKKVRPALVIERRASTAVLAMITSHISRCKTIDNVRTYLPGEIMLTQSQSRSLGLKKEGTIRLTEQCIIPIKYLIYCITKLDDSTMEYIDQELNELKTSHINKYKMYSDKNIRHKKYSDLYTQSVNLNESYFWEAKPESFYRNRYTGSWRTILPNNAIKVNRNDYKKILTDKDAIAAVEEYFDYHKKAYQCIVSYWIRVDDGFINPNNKKALAKYETELIEDLGAPNNLSSNDYNSDEYTKEEVQTILKSVKVPFEEVSFEDYRNLENQIDDDIDLNTKFPNEDPLLNEKIEKHDELNPKLWNEDGTLKEEVHNKILEIANSFMEDLKQDGIKFDLKDIRLVGSNCSYNYTKDSDLDIHLIADSSSLNCPDDLYPLLYSSYRSIFNKNLDIDFYGIPVEIYVEVE